MSTVPTLYAESPSMRGVLNDIGRAATVRTGVFIRGEHGTGRTVVARLIHEKQSPGAPFVTVDCRGRDGEGLEVELFGTQGGPRADSLEAITRGSRLRAAIGGTLHLRRVADAPARVQQRLVRALRDREALLKDDREGAPPREVVALDVRISASAEPGIHEAVREGRQREDLFARLATIEICLPPLRQRREDIPALADHFIHRICLDASVGRKMLARPAAALLAAMPWHGNATELRGLLEAVIADHGDRLEISVEDLLAYVRLDGALAVFPPDGTLRQARLRFERDYILAVLDRHQGRVSDAARVLGVQRTNLYRKLRILQVPREPRRHSKRP